MCHGQWARDVPRSKNRATNPRGVLEDLTGQLSALDFDLGHRPIPTEIVGAQPAVAPIAVFTRENP